LKINNKKKRNKSLEFKMTKVLSYIDTLIKSLDSSLNSSDIKNSDTNDETLPVSVLTIQSTVVYGICGNKSAMFPLQLFGYNACPINTVQFSNHTGYPKWRGTTTNGNEFLELINGLQDNKLYNFEYVISGYMGSVSCIKELKKTLDILIKNLKSNNKQLFYVCDPAMGDNGKLYSEHFKPFLEIYKNDVIKYSTLFLPNATEASLILDIPLITNPVNAFNACKKFHNMGIKYVVITSIDDPNDKDTIHVVFSDINWKSNKYGYMKINKIHGYWVGTGDLTSALIFIWFNKTNDLSIAVQNTMNTMQSIILRTKKLNSKELILVGKQTMQDMLKPNIVFKPELIKP